MGVHVSMSGCSGNTAPPIKSQPTSVSETVITETPPVTTVEPTEKEKEPPSTESADQATEPTVTATEPTTAKLKEETKHTKTAKSIKLSAVENTEPTVEEPSKVEEIYVGIQWTKTDTVEIERLVIKKINTYRIAQVNTVATMLPGLTDVARYRANELITNFEYRGEQHVSTELKY